MSLHTANRVDMQGRTRRMALAKENEPDHSAELQRMADSAQEASELLKALAHESRLLILCLLAEGEKSVSELEEFLALRQSTVSQQLARLRLDGRVATRREGKTIYYSLAGDDVRLVVEAIYKIYCGAKPKRRS
jgi:DNA-binding transcriptional ArsR family regulator